jgi:hypothetical protein
LADFVTLLADIVALLVDYVALADFAANFLGLILADFCVGE